MANIKTSEKLDENVLGREIKLYIVNSRKPTFRITFLHENKSIFRGELHVFVNLEYQDNIDVDLMAKDLYYKLVVDKIKTKAQIYQIIFEMFNNKQKSNMEQRELDKIPLFQVRAKLQDYYEYKIEKEKRK